MPRRAGDEEPEPPGGRAAERQREFIDERYPEGLDPSGEQPKEEPAGSGGEDAANDNQHPEDRR
jgi:hypothetical protein